MGGSTIYGSINQTTVYDQYSTSFVDGGDPSSTRLPQALGNMAQTDGFSRQQMMQLGVPGQGSFPLVRSSQTGREQLAPPQGSMWSPAPQKTPHHSNHYSAAGSAMAAQAEI